MSTTTRPVLSERNPYYIGKQRYYELKHFCLQFPEWKEAYRELDGLEAASNEIIAPSSSVLHNPTEKQAFLRMEYKRWIEMVERVAKEIDATLSVYILKGVTEGLSYDILRVRYNIPCCKNTYYKLYRKFFWLLSKERR